MPLLDEETKNLAKVGMFRPIDVLFIAIFFCQFLAIGYQMVVPEQINPFTVIIILLLGASFLQLWTVLLILRTINFTVRTHAKVELMTEEAARKAVKLIQTASQAAEVESKAAAKK